jgi:GNAT superfamily N-acetyltransferase
MTTIRQASREDVPLILEFVRELAEYERAPDAVKLTEAELLRDGFPAPGAQRYFETLIAEEHGEPAGIALFFPVYSTWRGRAMHLEDLFVRPRFRGRGIGRALLEKVAALSVERGCVLLFWHVLDWNTPAIEFYKTLDAEMLDDWRRMRVKDEALRALAGLPATADGSPDPAVAAPLSELK